MLHSIFSKGSRVLALSLTAVLVGTVFMSSGVANALSGSDFEAGNIIDDGTFTNTASMSVSQIQDFLNAKVPTCDTYGSVSKSYYYNSSTGRINNSADTWVTTSRAVYGQRYDSANGTTKAAAPYICLKSYVENPTTHANNLQNPSASISGGQSAAQIIYTAAHTYNINPQVLIVTLQKEQSLVTDDWPWTNEYQIAMGYACPDTAPCDSQYFGFANQVTNAAAQFRRYYTNPNNYNYVVGNNTIPYNPSPSCGSSNVYIVNQATANLYDYTPYQPNAGALSGLSSTSPGSTVTCGAYGNRNFWWYFNNWFGSTHSDLVSVQGGGVYKLESGQKRAFPDGIIFTSYGYRWSDITIVSPSASSQIPDGPAMPYNVHYRDSRLVKSPNGGVYDVYNGTKLPFPDAITFASYSFKWSDALPVSDAELAYIPDGPAMPYNVHYRDSRLVSSGGGVYDVVNGTKRAFSSSAVFLSYGYRWSDVLIISDAELAYIPDGPAMPPKN